MTAHTYLEPRQRRHREKKAKLGLRGNTPFYFQEWLAAITSPMCGQYHNHLYHKIGTVVNQYIKSSDVLTAFTREGPILSLVWLWVGG